MLERCKRQGRGRVAVHGLSKHPLYPTWNGMIQRCYSENYIDYPSWGGRGIKVCERWHSVYNFIADMYYTYTKGKTLGRIDNDGDYSPQNCQWENKTKQNNNRRDNRLIEVEGGRFLTLAQAAREFNLPHHVLASRSKKGVKYPDLVYQGNLQQRQWGHKVSLRATPHNNLYPAAEE